MEDKIIKSDIVLKPSKELEYQSVLVEVGCTIIIEGTVKVGQFLINTDEAITFTGDTLIVNENLDYDIAIGKPAHKVSCGRWQIPRGKLNLSFKLKSLITKGSIKGFSIGKYGCTLENSGDIKFYCKELQVDGLKSKYVIIPNAESSSTKYTGIPVFYTELEYEKYKKELEFKRTEYLNSIRSNYKYIPCTYDEKFLNDILIKAIETGEFSCDNVTDILFVSNLVGLLINWVDDTLISDKFVDSFQNIKSFLRKLEDIELSLFKDKYPKETLCARIFRVLDDVKIAYWEEDECNDVTEQYKCILDQIELSEELHKLYFKDSPMRDYIKCERFLLGVNVYDEITNDFVETIEESKQFSKDVRLQIAGKDLVKATLF